MLGLDQALQERHGSDFFLLPPRTVEEEAGQADRAMEASTRLRSLCRLSSPRAAKVSMVKGVFWADFDSPFCALDLLETQMLL